MTAIAIERRDTKRRARRPDIQVLRGIAVLLVVLFHVGMPGLGGGFVGVDVFFVVSGFLVGGALAHEVATTGAIRIREFFARRGRRIVPAAMVTIAATAVAVAALTSPVLSRLWGLPWNADSFAKDELSAILYVPNLWFFSQGREYGADTSGSPVLHFWSLGVEEQFYIVAPFVLLAAWAVSRGRYRVFATTVGALGAASVAYSLLMRATDGNVGYFDPLGRAWEMIAGAAVAMALARGWSIGPPRVARALALVAGATIVASAVLVSGEYGWPRWTALIVVGATTVALAAGASTVTAPRFLAPLEWLGDRSYSWYLWHWPFISVAAHVVDRDLRIRELAGLAAASLVVAHFSFLAIERPAMKWAVSTPAARTAVLRRVGVFTAVAFVVVLACGSISSARTPSSFHGPVAEPAPPFVAEPPPTTAAPTPTPETPSEPAHYVRPDLDSPLLDYGWAVPSNVSPIPSRARRDFGVAVDRGCLLSVEHRLDPLPRCALGDGPITVVVFGDSHAAHWMPALEPWVEEGAITLVPIAASGCVPFVTVLDDVKPGCDRWRERALARLAEVSPDIVVTAARYHREDKSDQLAAEIVAGFAGLIHTTAPGTDVFFVLDTPYLEFPADECAVTNARDLHVCATAPSDAISFDHAQVIGDGVLAAGGGVVDMSPYLCNSDTCGIVTGNVLIYRDDHHLTATYARLLAEPFGAAIGLTHAAP